MANNLFDQLDEIATGGEQERPLWAARAPYQPQDDFDLMLVPRVQGLAGGRRRARGAGADRGRALGREHRPRAAGRSRRASPSDWIEATGAALDRRRGAVARRPRRRPPLRAQLLGRQLDQGAAHRPPAQPRARQRARRGADRGRRQGRAAQHHLRRRPQHGRGDGRRGRRAAATRSPRSRAARRATTSSAPVTPSTSSPAPR